MRSATYERFAGLCAIAVAVGGLVYSIAFMTNLKTGNVSAGKVAAVVLMGGGILSLVVMVAIYGLVRDVDADFARLGLLLATLGALGSTVHGGSDLARFLHKVSQPLPKGLGDLPNAVDPRGLLTFAMSGLALVVFGFLLVRTPSIPVRLGQVGFVAGGLLVIVYLGRLIILNPKNPVVLAVASASGFLAGPGFFVWLGLVLRRGAARSGPA